MLSYELIAPVKPAGLSKGNCKPAG